MHDDVVNLKAARGAHIWVVAATTLGALLAAAGCGSVVAAKAPAHDSAAKAGASTAATKQPAPPKEPVETPKTKLPRPSDPLAPNTMAPVIRGGTRPHPALTARPEPFAKPVTYPDGLQLRVTGITQGMVTAQGPGSFPGQPTTTFSVTLTNRSKKPVTLNQVVATATYGMPARLARPVYDAASQDFGGTVRPGASARAVYAFSIPSGDLGRVTVIVDFDGTHTAATFRGAAK